MGFTKLVITFTWVTNFENERTDRRTQLVEISGLRAWNRSPGLQKFNYQPVNHNLQRHITEISTFLTAQVVSFHNESYFNGGNGQGVMHHSVKIFMQIAPLWTNPRKPDGV
jgi:hypothetical protein